LKERISHISLGVEDLDRSRAFYERLGWKCTARPKYDIAFFQLGPLIMSLVRAEALASDAASLPLGSGFRGIALGYNTRSRDEVDRLMAEAKRAGATILRDARDVFWGGYSSYFADPDGVPWEIVWNPRLICPSEDDPQLSS
jgi:catechol 2,3-dioxygenase-like lactoylglutathione lyase family enzyme